MTALSDEQALVDAKEDFVAHWGALGSTWGVSRTMAQIHALLLVAGEPMSTDEVMERLRVSRGNANTNLRELVSWGLIRSVVVRGQRKEYFEAEKDVWRIFCIIARERKKREIDPALAVLESCGNRTRDLDSVEGRAFYDQITALSEFVELAASVLDRISKSEQQRIVQGIIKLLR